LHQVRYFAALPFHQLLGRNVNHDPRSLAYPVAPAATELAAVRHAAHIAVLDQGELGSCCGNAGVSAIYHEPYVEGTVIPWVAYAATESGAVALYSRATQLDDYAGSYPPTDTGSDGLSVAKALKAAGIISGYQHAFTLQSALLQLMATPLITGISWYNSMFDAGPDGVLTVDLGSGLAGSHELCVDEYRPAVGNLPALVGGPNSWGPGWGDRGRWYLTVDDWGTLLEQDGDVTAFVPVDQPAPTPTPDPEPADDPYDAVLWTATKAWAAGRHTGSNATAARAVTAWAKSKGFA
jgi:hypothetical protein